MGETEERICKKCGKRIFDKKIPYCLRCSLEKRNTAFETTGKVSAVIGAFLTAKNYSNKKDKI